MSSGPGTTQPDDGARGADATARVGRPGGPPAGHPGWESTQRAPVLHHSAPAYPPPPHGYPPPYYGPPPGPVPGGGGPGGPRRGRTALIVVLCVVVLLAVAGLVAATTGLASRVLPSSAAPATPAPPTAVGDPHTADPCSLLTESSMRRFGNPRMTVDYGGPNSCGIVLRSNGPGELTVTAALAVPDPRYPPEGTATPAGPLTVYRQAADGDECGRVVRTADGTEVYLWSQAWNGGRGDLCAIAEAATSTTVSALSAGPLPRRAQADPPGALTSLDVCAVADATAVGRASGVDTTLRQPGFANWTCTWGDDPAYDDSPYVSVSIERYFQLTGTSTRIGNRTADVAPSTEAGVTTCAVSLVQRRYVDADGANRVEILRIEAYAGRQKTADPSCRNARAVAEAVAPKLPPAS